MLDYLKRVLELARPYRLRLVIGLFCGFLSGALAFTLPVSLKLAVDTVFPQEKAIPVTNSTAIASSPPANVSAALDSNQSASEKQEKSSQQKLNSRLPAPLKRTLDKLVQWFRPPEHPSHSRLVLVIALIPAAMFLRSLLAYLNIYLLSWVGIRAPNDLRVRLFNHLMNLPLGFFTRASTGDLMAR